MRARRRPCPIPAFATSFGPFGAESAGFESALGALKAELQPGHYVIRQPSAERPAVLGLIGDAALETAVVEFVINGELRRRREVDLDGSGMLVASLPPSLLDVAGRLTLRVTSPLLGVLELHPIAGTSVRPAQASTAVPATAPGAQLVPAARPAPVGPAHTQPAPVQLPARSGFAPRGLLRAA